MQVWWTISVRIIHNRRQPRKTCVASILHVLADMRTIQLNISIKEKIFFPDFLMCVLAFNYRCSVQETWKLFTLFVSVCVCVFLSVIHRGGIVIFFIIWHCGRTVNVEALLWLLWLRFASNVYCKYFAVSCSVAVGLGSIQTFLTIPCFMCCSRPFLLVVEKALCTAAAQADSELSVVLV